MVGRTLKQAIDEHYNLCKTALAEAIKFSSSEEIRRHVDELKLAEKMQEDPSIFLAKQREMYAACSI